jgi:hypothetical protein
MGFEYFSLRLIVMRVFSHIGLMEHAVTRQTPADLHLVYELKFLCA